MARPQEERRIMYSRHPDARKAAEESGGEGEAGEVMGRRIDYAQPQHSQGTSDLHVPDYAQPRRSLWNSWWPVVVTLVAVIGGLVILGLASLHP